MIATASNQSVDDSFLTNEQKDDFARDGYVFVKGAFNPSEAQELVRWTQEIQDWPETPGRHMAYYENSLNDRASRVLQRIENFVPYHSGFSRVVSDGRMAGAVSELLGEPAVLFKDKINFKLPGGDGYKAHQDQQAGWSVYAPLFVSVLVAIDEQTIDNGCLEIAPGQNKRGMIGSEWEPLSNEDTKDLNFISYPTQSGDVLYFDSYVPHRSLPNLTTGPRRALYITYNALRWGDRRVQYFNEKRANFPPDIERLPGTRYEYRV